MNKQETIEYAIEHKKELYFFYSKKWRVFSPHKIGLKFPKEGGQGVLHVFGFQFDGRSHEGELIEGQWRCFKFEEMSRVVSREGEFHTILTEGGPGSCFDQIFKEIDY